MRTQSCIDNITQFQTNLYKDFPQFSKSEPVIGCLRIISVAVVDVGVNVIKTPGMAIECIGMAAINLLKIANSSSEYTVRDALWNVEASLVNVINTPVAVVMAPIELIYQIFAIIINPSKVQSIGSIEQVKGKFFDNQTRCLKNKLYKKLHDVSKNHSIVGRLSAVPVAIVDVALSTLRLPFAAIEQVALAVINLFGAAFSLKYTLKHALFYTKSAFSGIASAPVHIAMAPVNIIYQIFAIVINPHKVCPIDARNNLGTIRVR